MRHWTGALTGVASTSMGAGSHPGDWAAALQAPTHEQDQQDQPQQPQQPQQSDSQEQVCCTAKGPRPR